jgi:hypothetical protein
MWIRSSQDVKPITNQVAGQKPGIDRACDLIKDLSNSEIPTACMVTVTPTRTQVIRILKSIGTFPQILPQ